MMQKSFNKEKLNFSISLITSCDNRKWRQTMLSQLVLPTHQDLPLETVWCLNLLSFTRSSYDNFSIWGQKITRPEVNLTKIFDLPVDICSVNYISKNRYKYVMYKKYLGERRILKLRSFSLITGSWRFCFRRNWYILKIQIRCYNVMPKKFDKRKFENFDFLEHFLWRPEVTADDLFPTEFAYSSRSTICISLISKSFSVYEI